jgi:eukaryotic-like serine/threonine-protein kinase
LRPCRAIAILGDEHCSRAKGIVDTITADDWRRIEHVLDTALTLPAGERATYVIEACAGDDALAAQVEALIALTEKPSFLDSPAAVYAAPILEVAAPPSEATPDLVEGKVFGRYRVVRELGRGGMATVYLAHRVDGQIEQRVALKVVASGQKSHELHRRFLVERQILARLDHPHIARLLDGGVTDDGQPWFAMEYIDGAHITEHCDARRLIVNDRLRLFRRVCEAVHYANANLVVHRDLKPSNILVTADGVVKLLDFGIAKAFGPESMMQPRLSRAGQRLMTPEYAAPEQVSGDAVTAAFDVYSLGAVLYELLSGRRVHHLERRAPGGIVDVLPDVDPEPPSDAVVRPPPERWPSNKSWPSPEDLADQRGTTPERLRRDLAGGLDSMVLKALARNPAQRYSSADALREDLERHCSGMRAE